MRFSVKNARVTFSSSANSEREHISFQVLPEGRDKLTIGSEYIFGKTALDDDKFKFASGRVHIEKLSENNKHLFEKDSIGYVKFFEEAEDEFGKHSYPALAIFSVYLPDERFNAIKTAVLSENPFAYLMCGVEGFDYSWEPDGSHKIWNLKPNESLVSYTSLLDVSISSIDVGFGNHFDDEYHMGINDEDPVKNLITQKDVESFKEWQKRIQQYLGVITGAIVLLTLVAVF